jgi:hypothetical protein
VAEPPIEVNRYEVTAQPGLRPWSLLTPERTALTCAPNGLSHGEQNVEGIVPPVQQFRLGRDPGQPE